MEVTERKLKGTFEITKPTADPKKDTEPAAGSKPVTGSVKAETGSEAAKQD